MNDTLKLLTNVLADGKLDDTDYLWLVGFFLCGDGNPALKMIQLKRANPRLCSKLNVINSHFHTGMSVHAPN